MVCPNSSPRWVLLVRIGLVAALVFVSSYCTQNGKQTENVELTPDEAYLVDAVARLAVARDLRLATYEKSESLFAVLDSTIDTTRVSKVIRDLQGNPERWIFIFRRIEQAADLDGDGASEEGR
jgi:hypothetical protein